MKKWMIVLALLVLAGPVGAAEMDKQRLRRLADMPTVSVKAEFGFSTSNGFSFNDREADPLVEMARIRKELKGDADDAERYRRMALLYARAKRKKESEDAYDKALALCRQRIKEHPDDMTCLVQLGTLLVSGDETKEGEAVLRRAVKQAPNDWRAWLALGRCLDTLAIDVIVGNQPFSWHLHDEKAIIAALAERKLTAEQIEKIRRWHKEAGRCFDRAVTLAPREKEPYFRRAASRVFEETVQAGLRGLKGEKVNLKAATLTPRLAADLRQLARLSPDDPRAIGVAVTIDIMACILHDPHIVELSKSPLLELMQEPNDRSLVDFLPKVSREFVRWGMERLELLTKNIDKSTATDASEVLATALLVIHMADDDDKRPEILREFAAKVFPRIVEHLRRAVRLDPTNERAWDLLTTGLLAHKGRAAEAVAAAEQRIQIKDNAHNRFMLAKCYAQQQQFDKAAEQLRTGLKSDESDLNCRLGLVAVLMQRDDAEALKQAGEQLDAVAARLKQKKSKSGTTHYQLLRGLHAALSDRPEQAKELLQSILRQDAGNTSAVKALVALGIPVTQADESLAIAYLARKTKIERADKWPDSPVVKVHSTDDKIADDDLFFLSAFPQLRELHLYSDSITDAGLVHLKCLPALRRLELNCYKITDKGLIRLQPLTNLRSLDLNCTKVTDAGLVHLEAFHCLESLTLPDNTERWIDEKKQTITDVGLAHLRKLPTLRAVSLGQPLTDESLAHLAALPRLQKLYASYSKITDDGMKSFERCKQLRELWLSGTEINGAGLAHLKGLRQLRELHLDLTKITDAGLAHLKGLTDLEILTLESTAITDAGLVHLRGMIHLRKLSLGEFFAGGGPFPEINDDMELLSFLPGQKPKPAKKPTKPRITDAGLKYLEGLTALERLDLTGLPLTGSGLAHLRRSNSLGTFFLDSTRINDATLAHLEQFPRLEWVCLDGTNITDAGLTHLHKLKRLKFVSLDETKVTDKGIAELRKVFPKLDISR